MMLRCSTTKFWERRSRQIQQLYTFHISCGSRSWSSQKAIAIDRFISEESKDLASFFIIEWNTNCLVKGGVNEYKKLLDSFLGGKDGRYHDTAASRLLSKDKHLADKHTHPLHFEAGTLGCPIYQVSFECGQLYLLQPFTILWAKSAASSDFRHRYYHSCADSQRHVRRGLVYRASLHSFKLRQECPNLRVDVYKLYNIFTSSHFVP